MCVWSGRDGGCGRARAPRGQWWLSVSCTVSTVGAMMTDDDDCLRDGCTLYSVGLYGVGSSVGASPSTGAGTDRRSRFCVRLVAYRYVCLSGIWCTMYSVCTDVRTVYRLGLVCLSVDVVCTTRYWWVTVVCCICRDAVVCCLFVVGCLSVVVGLFVCTSVGLCWCLYCLLFVSVASVRSYVCLFVRCTSVGLSVCRFMSVGVSVGCLFTMMFVVCLSSSCSGVVYGCLFVYGVRVCLVMFVCLFVCLLSVVGVCLSVCLSVRR